MEYFITFKDKLEGKTLCLYLCFGLYPYMSLSFGIIINPHAKLNQGEKSKEVLDQINAIGQNHVIANITDDLTTLENVLRIYHDQKIQYLGISGGDGTVHNVISKWYEITKSPAPPILILRGGTMNIVADSLKIKGKPSKVFKKFFKIWQKENRIKTTSRKTLSINGKWGNIFGAGVATNFMDYYYSGGGMGAYKAAKTISKTMYDSFRKERPDSITRKTKATIYVEGKRLPLTEFMAVLSLTVRNLPLGFKPMYRAYEDEDRFHIYVNNMRASQLPFIIHNAFLGKPVKRNGHFDLLVKNITIQAEESIRYTIDGDMHEAKDGKIEINLGKNLQYGYLPSI